MRVQYGEHPASQEAGILELREAASLARASRLIGALEEKIVGSAAQLSTRAVNEVMLPARDMAIIPEDVSLADALIRAHVHMHTRYPTCSGTCNPQTLTGYVNFKDIVSALKINPGDARLKNIVRPLPSIEGRTSLSEALGRMIRDNAHIARVTDEAGTVTGLVTLEDLLEELVGEIGDEYDRLPAYLHPLTASWIAGGGVLMETVAQAVGVPAPGNLATKMPLAAWCEKRLGRPPGSDDLIQAEGLEVQVRKIRRGRLLEAVIRRLAPPGQTPSERQIP